jgi:hypothetical protein
MSLRKYLFLLLLLPASAGLKAQAKTHREPKEPKDQANRIDTVAISILDRMSAMIGSLNACTFTVHSNYDITSHYLGLVKHSDEEQVFLKGSDHLLIRSEGDKGSRTYLFNGKTFDYYSMDKNQYGELDAPATTLAMIDTINKAYGIDFPAADFFYPTFVDDILSESKILLFLGITQIDGKDCYHIAGTAKNKTYQFWISTDAYSLPVKVVIVYTDKEMNPQFEATLTDWKINPDLPDALFDFNVPPNAMKIKLTAKTIKH